MSISKIVKRAHHKSSRSASLRDFAKSKAGGDAASLDDDILRDACRQWLTAKGLWIKY